MECHLSQKRAQAARYLVVRVILSEIFAHVSYRSNSVGCVIVGPRRIPRAIDTSLLLEAA